MFVVVKEHIRGSSTALLLGGCFPTFPTFYLNLLNCHGKLNSQPNHPQVVLPFWDSWKPYPVVGVSDGVGVCHIRCRSFLSPVVAIWICQDCRLVSVFFSEEIPGIQRFGEEKPETSNLNQGPNCILNLKGKIGTN